MKKWNVILHPTDFSAQAQLALKLACAIARDRGARLIVLHVAPQIPTQWSRTGTLLLGVHKHWTEANDQLRQLNCADLQPERVLRTGQPADVIATVAKQVRADLIVIGQPRPGKWNWLFEQRVADTLTRTSPCPLLIAAAPTASASEPDAKRATSNRRPDRPTEPAVSVSSANREWAS